LRGTESHVFVLQGVLLYLDVHGYRIGAILYFFNLHVSRDILGGFRWWLPVFR